MRDRLSRHLKSRVIIYRYFCMAYSLFDIVLAAPIFKPFGAMQLCSRRIWAGRRHLYTSKVVRWNCRHEISSVRLWTAPSMVFEERAKFVESASAQSLVENSTQELYYDI